MRTMADARLGDEADMYEAMVANERVEGWMDVLQDYVARPGDASAASRAKRAAQELAEAASRSTAYEEVRFELHARACVQLCSAVSSTCTCTCVWCAMA